MRNVHEYSRSHTYRIRTRDREPPEYRLVMVSSLFVQRPSIANPTERANFTERRMVIVV
jgi:hypothetical protein